MLEMVTVVTTQTTVISFEVGKFLPLSRLSSSSGEEGLLLGRTDRSLEESVSNSLTSECQHQRWMFLDNCPHICTHHNCVPAGVHHSKGCVAAPELFNCVIDHLMSRVCEQIPGVPLANCTLEDLEYADDTILFRETSDQFVRLSECSMRSPKCLA